MASAQDNYRIALNVLARVGIDGDLVGEYSKAMAMLHGLDSYNQMQPPPMPQQIPQEQPPVPEQGGTMPPEMGQNTPQTMV